MISATVIGNLGRDAELRSAGSTSVVSFNVASTEKGKDGETTTWIKCSLFGQRAEKIVGYLSKGTKVACRGSLSQRQYTGKDGEVKSSLELKADDVEFLGGGEKKPQTQQTIVGARAAAAAASRGDAYEDPSGDGSFDDFADQF